MQQKAYDGLFLTEDCFHLQIFHEDGHLIVKDIHILHSRHVLCDDEEHLWAADRLSIIEVNQNQNDLKKLDHVVSIRLHSNEISVQAVFSVMTHHSILDVLVDINAHHNLKIFLIEHVHEVMSEKVMQTSAVMIVTDVSQLCCDEEDVHSFSEDELLLHDSLHSFYKNFHHVLCPDDFHFFFLSD